MRQNVGQSQTQIYIMYHKWKGYFMSLAMEDWIIKAMKGLKIPG